MHPDPMDLLERKVTKDPLVRTAHPKLATKDPAVIQDPRDPTERVESRVTKDLKATLVTMAAVTTAHHHVCPQVIRTIIARTSSHDL